MEGKPMRMAAIILFAGLTLAARGGGNNTEVVDQPNSANQPFGPLAATSGKASGAEAVIHGVLKVTEECVFIQEGGEDVLLVWGAGQVSWNAVERALSIKDDDGTVVVTVGDQISLGGGGSSAEEGGGPAKEWADGIDWISRPASACLTDTRWFVGSVQTVSTG